MGLSIKIPLLREAVRRITYRDNIKYCLTEGYTHVIPSTSPLHQLEFESEYFVSGNGVLFARKGYAWDGPSGPTIDTQSSLRGSLVHDIYYQAMQLELIPSAFKVDADKELRRVCREDGMPMFRAWYFFVGVKIGGGKWVRPREQKSLTAGVDA